jgi:hypothetical protein
MATACVIENGVVLNSIVVDDDADLIALGGALKAQLTLGPPESGIGWTYDGATWTPPAEPEMPVPDPAPLQPLTARQLRLGLLKLGIKPSQVDAAIDTLPDNRRETAQIEWEYATTYQRDHTLIALLASAFGLSDATVDAAWRGAETL